MDEKTTKEVKSGGRVRPPRAGMGRPPGTTNKLTRAAKEAFMYAFDNIGGVHKLTQWAYENPTEFYKLYARLIPQELTGTIGVFDVDADAADVRRRIGALVATRVAELGAAGVDAGATGDAQVRLAVLGEGGATPAG